MPNKAYAADRSAHRLRLLWYPESQHPGPRARRADDHACGDLRRVQPMSEPYLGPSVDEFDRLCDVEGRLNADNILWRLGAP
jgi:hypothetical protein